VGTTDRSSSNRDVSVVSFKCLNDNYRLNGYKIKQILNKNGDDKIMIFRLFNLHADIRRVHRTSTKIVQCLKVYD